MRRQSQLRFARRKKLKAIKKSKGEKKKQVDLSWRRVRRMKGFCKYLRGEAQILKVDMNN